MYKENLHKIRIGTKETDILERFTSLEKAEKALPSYQKCWSNAYKESPQKLQKMKLSRSYTDATEEQRLDDDMQDEIKEMEKFLKRYNTNLKTLLDKKRANQVRKAMINYLVEQL